MLRQHPEIWQRVGDLAGQVKEQFLDLIAGKSAVAKESIELYLDSIRGQIVNDEATPLERVLMERIVITFMDVAFHQIAAHEPRTTLKETRLWQVRRDSAQRRHFAAIKELARLQQALRESDQTQEHSCQM